MYHSFLIVYYWNDTEFLTLPQRLGGHFQNRKQAIILWNKKYSELIPDSHLPSSVMMNPAS
ncbi:hypothetical protein FNN91_23975 [Salmonella enterica subsp. salamae]|nr:hypothetical protein [Salmonella enterica subsp. salamae]